MIVNQNRRNASEYQAEECVRERRRCSNRRKPRGYPLENCVQEYIEYKVNAERTQCIDQGEAAGGTRNS